MTKQRAATLKKQGRPSKFTDALAGAICRRLAEGESLRHEASLVGNLVCWITSPIGGPGQRGILPLYKKEQYARGTYTYFPSIKG